MVKRIADQPGKGTQNMRIERYYNALIGRSRPGVAPTIQEARKDLNRALETQFPFYSSSQTGSRWGATLGPTGLEARTQNQQATLQGSPVCVQGGCTGMRRAAARDGQLDDLGGS